MDEYTPEPGKRCKNGMRKDSKTGRCVPIHNKTRKSNGKDTVIKEIDNMSSPLTILPNLIPNESLPESKTKSESEPKPEPKSKKQKRCGKNTRKNRKTGLCEPIVQEEPVVVVTEPVNSEKSVFIPAEPPLYDEPMSNPPVIDNPVTEINNPVATFAEIEDIIYPSLDDSDFSAKIAQHKEFAETRYDGEITDIKTKADILANAKYELMPHQNFVRNFLSINTPYNSLLLYHMLGTGKTCSAIGVAEEMRTYMQQLGLQKKIILVASPNVQNNFRKELFDERKLIDINGVWSIERTCVGNAMLKEINPMNLKGLTRSHIIHQIQSLINQYYTFMGYIEFANYMTKIMNVGETDTVEKRRELKIQNIREAFDNQLIIIDEVHNIGMTDNNANKRTGMILYEIAKYSQSMRLLLLSATPMYNSPTEIVWLANLLNVNDNRDTISVSDVFDKDGRFLTSGNPRKNNTKDKRNKKDNKEKENEFGRELLRRKLIGYVSFVRGENPYLFPFRVYPELFAESPHLLSVEKYPKTQMNGREIKKPLQYIPVYITKVGEYQEKGYKYIIQNMQRKSFVTKNGVIDEKKMPNFENMESFGYTMLYAPMEALNIVYPTEILDQFDASATVNPNSNANISKFIGKGGLENIVSYKLDEELPLRYDFEYKKDIVKKYGYIFSPDELPKYSAKLSHICELIKKSKGIVLVYSQYIDGGIVPMALALEEMGFGRFGSAPHTKNLFAKPRAKTEAVDSLTMKTRKEMGENVMNFQQAKYVMITGDKHFSPNNDADVKFVTHPDNRYGKNVKVILISKAASEGVDFKNIRQLHILESWYNMNRIEQTIGRGVRNKSHIDLPFEERNVQIFLHGSKLSYDQEPADLYVYRVAERKSRLIGEVTRLLKQNSVDCVLNIEQTNFTAENILEVPENQTIEIELSTGKIVEKFPVGDRPFTDICDYMDNCSFQCEVSPSEIGNDKIGANENTYSEDFIKSSSKAIISRIVDIYREHFAIKREKLIDEINIIKRYPINHIYYTLGKIVGNKTEELVDKYGRTGYLLNRGEYYVFQPMEINDEHAQMLERIAPVEYKHSHLQFELPKQISSTTADVATKKNQESEQIATSSNAVVNDFNFIIADLDKYMLLVHQTNLKVPANEKNWYKHANKCINILIDVHEIPLELINKYVVYHYLDILDLPSKLILVNEIYGPNGKDILHNKLIGLVKLYFDEHLIHMNNIRGILLAGKSNDGIPLNKIFIQDEQMNWKEAEYTEAMRFKDEIKRFIIDKNAIFEQIGFMHLFKGNEVVFKIKDITLKRNNLGAKCEDAGKPAISKKLKIVLGVDYYDDVNIDKYGLGVLLEFIMRFKTETSKKDKIYYFFNPEETLVNKIPEFRK